MPLNEKDTYFVAVKVFLLNQEGELFIFKDNFGDWDLPGGRIKPDEFDTPLEQIIARKMKEELGENVQYTLGKPVVHMRHERVEQSEGNPAVRIFAVGYEAQLDSEEVQLSSRHTESEWVDPKTFDPTQYFTGGWLKGIQEYQQLRQNVE